MQNQQPDRLLQPPAHLPLTTSRICGYQGKNISVNNEAENVTDGANNSAVRPKDIAQGASVLLKNISLPFSEEVKMQPAKGVKLHLTSQVINMQTFVSFNAIL